MIYSVGCEYGIRALTNLASVAPAGKFCLLRDILEGTDLPQHFVGKIFQTLVRAEILVSAKGRGGGFALKRPPEEITLRSIVTAIDGSHRITRCILGFNECNDEQPCAQHDNWKEIRSQIELLLDTTTLANLAAAVNRKNAARRLVKKA
jgi:Rrf2 family transcriptional regulator, iron-sulfur cluster assembly transcription factor